MGSSRTPSSLATCFARPDSTTYGRPFDERFTSVLAHQAILEGGVKKKTRRENKGLVDQVSATIILQDYMRAQGL